VTPRVIATIGFVNVILIVAVLRGWWFLVAACLAAEMGIVLRALANQRAMSGGGAGGPGDGRSEDGPGGAGTEDARPLLEGTVDVADLTWDVTEERRGGPWSQLLVLKARDAGSGVMHVRPGPGEEARSLEDVEAYAQTPALRYFTGPDGTRWQARIVLAAGENGSEIPLVKFISKDGAVREGPFTGIGGLGQRTDEELRTLLDRAEAV
jgi:hypothetical protein